MRPDRQAHPGVIGLQALAGIHRSQRRAGWLVVSGWWLVVSNRCLEAGSWEWLGVGTWELRVIKAREHLTSRPDSALNLPERTASFVGERIECTNVGKRRQLVTAQAGALHDVLDRSEAAGRPQLHGPVVRADVAEIGAGLARVAHHFNHRLIVGSALG